MNEARRDKYSTIIFGVVSTASLGLLGVFVPDFECEENPPFFLAGTVADCSVPGASHSSRSITRQVPQTPTPPVLSEPAAATLSTREQLFDHPGDAPAPVPPFPAR